jgi:hypothetical protein
MNFEDTIEFNNLREMVKAAGSIAGLGERQIRESTSKADREHIRSQMAIVARQLIQSGLFFVAGMCDGNLEKTAEGASHCVNQCLTTMRVARAAVQKELGEC